MDHILENLISLHRKKLFKEALLKIQELEKEKKLDAITLNLKGLTYFFLNDMENALKSFNEALKTMNESSMSNEFLNASINNNIGLVNLKSGKYSDAIKFFNTAINRDANFTEAYNNLGLAFKNMGENLKSINFFLKANNSNLNHKVSRDNLIDLLSFQNIENHENNQILIANNKIKDLDFDFDNDKKINTENIKKIYNQSIDIIDLSLRDVDFNFNQIFRRGKINLNCERHLKIFNNFKIISEFCFNCYKVLIEPSNVVDLIKLHIFFDNLNLENNNVRKCMIEYRKNVNGTYKGLIYCRSLKEAKDITEDISLRLKTIINENINIKIKHGCTDYYNTFPKYKNLDSDTMTYDKKWKNIENTFDQQNPSLKNSLKDRSTIKGNCLKDILTIRNWLYFSKLKGDNSYQMITENIYPSKYIENLVNN